jgi:hypothetical protein
MTEENDIFAALKAASVIDLLDWASTTAFARVAQDYDEDAGHDQSVAGFLAYKYLLDLLDRATSSGKYALPEGASADHGRDILRQGISTEAFEAMPRLDPDFINRSNFNGSPGWAFGDVRWLLQSCRFGDIDKLIWGQKSDSKLQVANQPFIDADTVLFDFADLDMDEPETVAIDEFVGSTLILAHAFNRENGSFEVYIGRSRAPEHWGDGPWHWRRLIVSGGTGGAGGGMTPEGPKLPGTPPSTEVEDAVVKLRPAEGEGTNRAEGN